MINNWMIPRAKRKLTPVVYTLSAFSYLTVGEPWIGDIQKQLQFEAMLERFQIKAPGPRRNQDGGGARTYETWLSLLGLIFSEPDTGLPRLTLAGEAIADGDPPVPILTEQLLKLQYPSPYTLRANVSLHLRFRIRPFRFLLRLLADPRLGSVSEAEIARFVITEADDESERCYEHVVHRILLYRLIGEQALPPDLAERYPSSQQPHVTSVSQTLKRLRDNANTFVNYLEYTQWILRSDAGIHLHPDRVQDVHKILSDGSKLSPINPADTERFQRHYGLPPGKTKDTRNLVERQNITHHAFEESLVRAQLLYTAGTRPITVITPMIVAEIAETTGLPQATVNRVLEHTRINTQSVFEARYIHMAFAGRDEAVPFERATVAIFQQFGYDTQHVGPQPLHPDIVVTAPNGTTGILDTKAYHAYAVSNDHRNRMVHNYIPRFQGSLRFFQYIAGGFGPTIDRQIQSIADETHVPGSAITAKDLLDLLRQHQTSPITHQRLQTLFQVNRRITESDLQHI